MSGQINQKFLDAQRARLTALHKQLLEVRGGQEREDRGVNADLAGQAREYEDDAQKLASLELQGALGAADDERLSNIERALQKIDDGTYGLSDASGKPIPLERLQASPEAIYTLEEQKTRDASR